MSRKLATVQEISGLFPIEGADNIVLAKFRDIDFECVVKKGEFQVGDPSIYLEIDSLVHNVPGCEFMEARKWRVKTIKLKGCLSQGLALPLQSLGIDPKAVKVGDDLTNKLRVEKYESPTEKMNKGGGRFGLKAKDFPVEIANKTDEVRAQSISRQIDELQGVDFIAREKLDGSSVTFVMNPRGETHRWLKPLGRFGDWLSQKFEIFEPQKLVVCSRNLQLKHPSELKAGSDQPGHFWNVAKRFNVEALMRDYVNTKDLKVPLVVQGEVVGPGTGSQGDYYQLGQHDLYVFDVSMPNPRGSKSKVTYVNQAGLDGVVRSIFAGGVKTAPVVFSEKLKGSSKDLLARAERKVKIEGSLKEVYSEGLVWRPAVEIIPEPGSKFENQRVSFKTINNKFLLKEKD